MRKFLLLLAAAFGTIYFWIFLAGFAIVHAQTPTPAVSLVATPNSIELASNQQIQLVVVAAIPVTTVRSITLTTFTDVGITTTLHDAARNSPPLRGSLAWVIDVTPTNAGPKEGTLYVRADYLQEEEGTMVPGVAFAQVAIHDRDLDPLNSIVDAQVDTVLETIKDQQTGTAYLRVSNLTDVPITFTRIRLSKPSFLTTIVSPTLPLTLQARQTRALEYGFEATDAVIPGKHLLVFEVEADWERNARQVQGTLVVTRTLNFEVLGQEFLGFAQIPSLFLLPGILAAATFIVLYRRAYPKQDPGYDLTKPEFWLAAVIVSMLALLVYTPLTTGLAQLLPTVFSPRSYLQAYGLRDIIGLWFGAVLFGLSVWAIWGSMRRWRERREQERLKGLQVNEVDSPAEVLRVLGNHKAGFDLKPVTFIKQEEGNPAQAQQVFVLPTATANQTETWVIPSIRVFWQDGSDAQRNQLKAAISQKSNPRALADVLENLARENTALVDWDQSKSLVLNPMPVAKNALKPFRGVADPLVNDA